MFRAFVFASLFAAAPAWAQPVVGNVNTQDPRLVPAFRTSASATDTPTLSDNAGFIAYTAAVTVTVNDLGAGKSYSLQQQGTGTVSIVAGSSVTLASDRASPSYKTATQWATLTVICTGTGKVSVIGNMQ